MGLDRDRHNVHRKTSVDLLFIVSLLAGLYLYSCDSSKDSNQSDFHGEDRQYTTNDSSTASGVDSCGNELDISGRKQGFWCEWYASGQRKSQAYYRNDTIDGLYKGFYPNGTLEYNLNLRKGLNVGDGRYYYTNGNLRMLVKSDMGVVTYIGKYDPEGHIALEDFFRQGKRHMSVMHSERGRDTSWSR